MATVVLVRHGRSTANTSGILAGRLPGVELDELGREQVARAGERLAGVPLAAVVTSPLERCRSTAAAVAAAQLTHPVPVEAIDDDLTECGYGDWQGRPLGELAKEPLWRVVQQHPSAAVFPGGESLAGMQSRAVTAIRRLDRALEREHGGGAVWVAVSHGDVIKSVLADALGMHLDLFQRIRVDPASVSIVRYGAERPEVLATNTVGGDLSWLAAEKTAPGSTVGGGAGPRAAHADPS
ncbi:histidine phosphatase family protein [Herbiconiux sp. KACC 21604]|uniref:histidine phosphatase family protein n=1 Tax=unclassified Herbiconiux TaxID=2618217 RepID=UPI001491E270|nr:histidine phosphatase family protein [Herbiconiux sp. SALV-R1]QJU53095.1 MSMEG_4193 family putative phosphomutase [Herbiconiux sp. SALV-R1]WPO88031.1 histidine phosphatase family protein [Herbiconiux sp. KACC 21604]